ncbi:hypothetical protein F2Q68_00038958 [Brassica cretica]|uniref:Uncharacterized protein n=2 Tax=Brassica cretica TaxID=69181 RepID=A0ABQ7AD67_BRACR|nr:hypothetical protein F2Q68_00038958 [Brassica cretica]KAF3495573.1 hypothetical protein DY000_02052529 [Brassica cretica]
MGEPSLPIVDTSNTSPDSCVIDVKVGVVCDPIQYDSTAHDHSDALCLPAPQLSVGGRDGLIVLQDDGSTRSILFVTKYHEAYDAKKKKLGPQDTEEGLNRLRELQEGFCSYLFEDECDELLVESQELHQRVEIELDRFQEFKK